MSDQPSEEVKKIAFEKNCQIKIYQIYLLAEVINLASTRGAFKGPELSHVGALFDTLTSGVDKAFKMAKEDLEKVSSDKVEKLEVVEEEEEQSTETKKNN